jgi:hypothetical protein
MKFLKFVLFVILSSLIFWFVILININTYFSTSDFTKKFMEESNAYSAIAIGLRDNLAANTAEGSKEAVLQFAGDAIDEATVKQFLNNIIDQFFAIAHKPKAERKIAIPYSMIGQKISALAGVKNFDIMSDPQAKAYLTDKEIDLSNNPFVSTFANLKKLLLIYGGLILLFTILMLLGGTWPQRLRWLGFSFFLPALASAAGVLMFYLAGSTSLFQNAAKSMGLRDDRFVIAGGKIIAIFWTYQKGFYIAATIILFVISIVLLILSRQRKSDAEKMDLGQKSTTELPPVVK